MSALIESPTIITANENRYTIGRLTAVQQFHVARRLMPIQASLATAAQALAKEGVTEDTAADEVLPLILQHVGGVLAEMKEEDVDYVLHLCCGVAKREQGNGWASVMINKRFAFEDIDMTVMLMITIETVRMNLGNFFPMLQGGTP